jgi:hypothetical protein
VSLRIISRSAVGLRELSGLAVRGAAGAPELVCVGDHDFAILSIPLGERGVLGEEERSEVARALPPEIARAPGGSGFEGVACDRAGRVLVIQEGPSRVLVLAPDLTRLEAVVELAVSPDQPGFGPEWHAADNARGEGLLLMARGHLLVAKQKEPVCLIEFGPTGDAPLGVRPEAMAGADDDFAPRARRRSGVVPYAVLGWWALSPTAAERVESANDLALDERGRLLLVSSRSRRIARIAPADPAGHEAAIDDDWSVSDLPGRRKRRPEALCVVPGAVLVGLDARGGGDNLVALEPLD